MEIAFMSLINELFHGSARSVIAILVMIVVVLLNELRGSRRDLRRLHDKIDAQRAEYINNMTSVQDKYILRTEELSAKYHEAMMHNHTTVAKLTDVVQVIREQTTDRGD